MTARAHYKNYLIAAVTLLIFAVAVAVLHRSLTALSWSDVLEQLRAVSRPHVLLSILCAACSYGMLTFYDWFALRAVNRRLDYAQIAATSFTAFAIAHSVGVSSLSGGSIR